MNKVYDKLLLALALLALLAGLGFYFMKSGDLPDSQVKVSTQTADNPYETIPVPEPTEVSVNWPDVEPQSSGWVYDVFTPPEIYIGEDGQFTVIPWEVDDGSVPPPFGVYLASVSRDPYRIQITGYIEEDRSDASKSLVLFVDEESDQTVRARVGDQRPGSEFQLLDFTIERVRDADGNVQRVAKATILDNRSGKEVVLTEGERVYEDSVTVIIRSEQNPEVDLELSEEGETFETPLGEYILEEINLEESTVTVKKLANEELELEEETKVLSPRSPDDQSRGSAGQDGNGNTGSDEAEQSDDSFNFMF